MFLGEMTYAEALARRQQIQTELESLRAAKLRIVTLGQAFSQTDGDARNEIERVDFKKLCDEIRKLEAELADLDDMIARYEGHKPSRRRSIKMRCV